MHFPEPFESVKFIMRALIIEKYLWSTINIWKNIRLKNISKYFLQSIIKRTLLRLKKLLTQKAHRG